MAKLTINSGASDIKPGTYEVILVSVEGPKTVVAKNGPNAGQELRLLDWQFAIDDGGELDGATINDSSSMSSGPKSKFYGWWTALTGTAPATGSEVDTDLIVGQRALAKVIVSDSGWPKIDALVALPRKSVKAPAPAASAPAPAPVAAAPAPVAAAADAEIPF